MAEPYTRINLQGTLPGGEVWSINPAFREGTQGVVNDEFVTWAEGIRTRLTATPSLLPQQAAQLLTSAAAITNVRVTRYGASGKTLWYHDSPLAAPLTGDGNPTGPTTQAMVVSLEAGAFPTRNGRGRLFWPALRYPIDTSTTRFQKGALAGTLDDFHSMLLGIENAAPASIGAVLAVYSKVKGLATPVTSLRLGDVMDSQRRRKDALKEAYAAQPM